MIYGDLDTGDTFFYAETGAYFIRLDGGAASLSSGSVEDFMDSEPVTRTASYGSVFDENVLMDFLKGFVRYKLDRIPDEFIDHVSMIVGAVATPIEFAEWYVEAYKHEAGE